MPDMVSQKVLGTDSVNKAVFFVLCLSNVGEDMKEDEVLNRKQENTKIVNFPCDALE